jgi:hypothetical protein
VSGFFQDSAELVFDLSGGDRRDVNQLASAISERQRGHGKTS